jgi:hypothetical protein
MLWLDSQYPPGEDKLGVDRGSCPTDSGKFEDMVANHADASVAFCKTSCGRINNIVIIANMRLQPTSSLAPLALPSTQAVPTRLPRPPHALLLLARALLLPAHALLLLAHALPPFPALALALFPLGASVAVTSTLALPPVSLATAVAARVSGTLSAFPAKWPSPGSCAQRARSIFHISGSSKYWAVTIRKWGRGDETDGCLYIQDQT